LTENNICVICKKNPGTVKFPTKPLSRISGVNVTDVVVMCAKCKELADMNTNLGKTERALDVVVAAMEKLRKPDTPVEAENFIFDLDSHVKAISKSMTIVNGFISQVKQKQNKELSMADFYPS
jgi:hypothetical protein